MIVRQSYSPNRSHVIGQHYDDANIERTPNPSRGHERVKFTFSALAVVVGPVEVRAAIRMVHSGFVGSSCLFASVLPLRVAIFGSSDHRRPAHPPRSASVRSHASFGSLRLARCARESAFYELSRSHVSFSIRFVWICRLIRARLVGMCVPTSCIQSLLCTCFSEWKDVA